MSSNNLNLQHGSGTNGSNQGDNNNNLSVNDNESIHSVSMDTNANSSDATTTRLLNYSGQLGNANGEGSGRFVGNVNLGEHGYEALLSRLVEGMKQSYEEMLARDHGKRTPVKRGNENAINSNIPFKQRHVDFEDEDDGMEVEELNRGKKKGSRRSKQGKFLSAASGTHTSSDLPSSSDSSDSSDSDDDHRAGGSSRRGRGSGGGGYGGDEGVRNGDNGGNGARQNYFVLPRQLPRVQCPSFDGKGDIEQYIMKAEKYCDHYRQDLDDQTLIKHLVIEMKDTAWDFVQGVGPRNFKSRRRFFKVLRKGFKRVTTDARQLITMMQDPGESVQAFAIRLRRWVVQTNGSSSERKIDELCLEHFRVKVAQPLRDILAQRGDRKWSRCRDYAVEYDENSKNKNLF